MTTTNALAALLTVLTSAAAVRAQAEAPPGPPGEAIQVPASTTFADEPNAAGGALAGTTDPATDVHVSFTPYFWLTSFSGSISVDDIEVDIDKSAIDVLNGSDTLFGLMGALDVEFRRLVFQFNAAWGTVEGSDEEGIFRDGSLDAKVDVDGAFIELLGGYRLVDTPLGNVAEEQRRFRLDAYGGGRLTSIKVDMGLEATSDVTLPSGEVLTLGQSKDIEQSGDWFEPFVGLRGSIDLDEHWMIQARGDVGGFGVDGSEFAWQAAAVIGYRWRCDGWTCAVVGGYRALGQDYTEGDFNWDVVTHGPLVGMAFSWSF